MKLTLAKETVRTLAMKSNLRTGVVWGPSDPVSLDGCGTTAPGPTKGMGLPHCAPGLENKM